MINFKEESLRAEWNELLSKNPRLRGLVDCLHTFVQLEFNKDVVITHIFRTPEQQADLYKDTPADKRPVTSPHMRWEAVDIRSTTFTAQEIEKMLRFLNCFTYAGGQRNVALYHIIAGNNWHFHIQYR